jgi:hypothetical protein
VAWLGGRATAARQGAAGSPNACAFFLVVRPRTVLMRFAHIAGHKNCLILMSTCVFAFAFMQKTKNTNR